MASSIYTAGYKIRGGGSTPQAPGGKTTTLKPPTVSGQKKTVELSFGNVTTTVAKGLGVNIGELTAYAQANTIDNLVTQGGGFELGTGRILEHVMSGTSNTITVSGGWAWWRLGYGTAVGQRLVGSGGTNAGKSYLITGMTDQLDASGNPTGNAVITISGSFDTTPVYADSFYVDVENYNAPLSNNTQIFGNATAGRDNSIAHNGKSSAMMTLGDGWGAGVLNYYFGVDANAGRNVLRQEHTYQFSFWARTTNAGETAAIRLVQGNNSGNLNVGLVADGQWHQYSLTVVASNPVVVQNGVGSITISGANGQVNVDDVKLVDLADQISATNPLSKEIEGLIRDYGFSELRFWHPSLRFAKLDDVIGSRDSRPMIVATDMEYDPQFGLPEMLQLAKDTGTTPWITLSTTWTTQEIHNLMEYLYGDVSTPYGAKRAADGHAASWAADLPMIHFEAGNESWNGTFFPNSYQSFDAYWDRAEEMFSAFKSDPLYAANASKLELIVNGWQWVPWFTEQSVANVPSADAVDISAYVDSPQDQDNLTHILDGALSQSIYDNAKQVPTSINGKKVYVYEEAPGEIGNSAISAETIGNYATSLGAGLAAIRNSMLLTRDYGISTQNLFTLMQRGNNLPSGYTLGYYGIFADLTTAATNPRPIALAAKLLNQNKGTVVSSSLTSGWTVDATATTTAAATTQAADAMVTISNYQLVITFFNNTMADDQNTLFHFNLPTTFNGRTINADWNSASFQILAGASITSNNETAANVAITNGQYTHSTKEAYVALPAHSMGTLVIPLK